MKKTGEFETRMCFQKQKQKEKIDNGKKLWDKLSGILEAIISTKVLPFVVPFPQG